MKKKFRKIYLWWRFEARYFHKDFIRGVKNLWRWFPTVWKDRDWDQHYIYEMLAKKIEFQAEYIGSRDFHTEAKRDAERMRLVAKLIRLEQEDFYGTEYMDYHETKFEFVPTDETEEYFTMEDELISERFDEYFAKYPRQYKKALSGELNIFERDEIDPENKHSIAMEIAHHNQARCKALLFKLMEENISRWWD
jgi:hypothetical protein